MPSEPVTLEEIKAWCRVDDDDDDVLLTDLGVAAREFVETATGRDFATDPPERAKVAIKALVAHFYEAREPIIVGHRVETVPLHIRSLIAQLRGGVLEPADDGEDNGE